MKSYNHLYEKLLDKEYIKSCIYKAAKGKRSRHDVQNILNNIDYHIDQVYHIMATDSFFMKSHKKAYINESSCKKVREIIRPSFKYETIIQHMIVGIIQPIIVRKLYQYACASIPDKGSIYGKKRLELFIKRNKSRKLYVLKFDIRKFFEHIDRSILLSKLKKIIRDKRFIGLLSRLIYFDDVQIGIPLGFYSSQWFANLYLTEFDFYVKQTLHAPFYMRYMDDIVIVASNKRALHSMKRQIESFLTNNLHLTMKADWQIYLLWNVDKSTNQRHGRFVDYMGFKFYNNRTTLRKSTLYRIRLKANKIAKTHRLNKKINWYVSAQMISKMGWLYHCKTYKYYMTYLKPKVNVHGMRRQVSNHSKHINLLTKGLINHAA